MAEFKKGWAPTGETRWALRKLLWFKWLVLEFEEQATLAALVPTPDDCALVWGEDRTVRRWREVNAADVANHTFLRDEFSIQSSYGHPVPRNPADLYRSMASEATKTPPSD